MFLKEGFEPGPYELVVFVWGDDPRRFPLPKTGQVTIGRERRYNDIAIPDSSVSRIHATLTLGEKIMLTDLSSRNGTLVRRSAKPVRVDETRTDDGAPGKTFEVRGGDRLSFGSVISILRNTRDESALGCGPLASGRRMVRDPAMVALYGEVAELAASSNRACVLILGETGVGKELLARAIHDASPRAKNAYVVVNCANINDGLFESEMFGHRKGAFTGATFDKKGLFELANGGTLVLDEIGELTALTQAKLLRVLEDRQVLRLGAEKPMQVDVRIVASTNRNLEECVLRRQFREDLYYRLKGFELVIPPLRSRPDEILPLAQMFLEEECKANGQAQVPQLSPDAAACLVNYSFPGNVRELRSAMGQAAVFCHNEVVMMHHLPPKITGMNRAPCPRETEPETPKQNVDEQMRMLQALHAHRWNIIRAAKSLNMPKRTFQYKMKRYGIEGSRAARTAMGSHTDKMERDGRS